MAKPKVFKYRIYEEGGNTYLNVNDKDYGPFGDEETARMKLDEITEGKQAQPEAA